MHVWCKISSAADRTKVTGTRTTRNNNDINVTSRLKYIHQACETMKENLCRNICANRKKQTSRVWWNFVTLNSDLYFWKRFFKEFQGLKKYQALSRAFKMGFSNSRVSRTCVHPGKARTAHYKSTDSATLDTQFSTAKKLPTRLSGDTKRMVPQMEPGVHRAPVKKNHESKSFGSGKVQSAKIPECASIYSIRKWRQGLCIRVLHVPRPLFMSGNFLHHHKVYTATPDVKAGTFYSACLTPNHEYTWH